jgi:phospholipid N-methyltransferase
LDELVLSMGRRYREEKEKLKQLDLSWKEQEALERDLQSFKWTFDKPKDQLAPYKRIMKLGITSEEAFQQIKRDIDNLKPQEVPKTEEDRKREQITALEDQIRWAKIPGFFPTPEPVATKMVDYADIESSHSILEPSAGNGLLADVILKETGRQPQDIDAVEIMAICREILEIKGYPLVGSDFLQFNGKFYDRVLMNPPFEGETDVIHVLKAYSLLKAGGKLVAIMSAGITCLTNKCWNHFCQSGEKTQISGFSRPCWRNNGRTAAWEFSISVQIHPG